MTRISELSQNQTLISELSRANLRASKTELEVSSGKKAQYFRDLAEEAGVLFSAKRVLDRNTHYSQTVTELQQRLDTQALNMNEISDAAGGIRQKVTEALANDSGLMLMEELNGYFQRAVASLNTQINGQYVFGGTRTDVAPVNIQTLDDLAAAPSVADIFENNDLKPSAVVDDGLTLQYGFLASDLATGLMSAIKAIKEFNDGPDGPIGEHLTTTQRDFLTAQVAGLKQIGIDITGQSARNGILQQQADKIEQQLEDTRISAEQFVADIEDVDLAEALTRLQQDQLAVQAATRMVAEIGRMSLLDFLPIA